MSVGEIRTEAVRCRQVWFEEVSEFVMTFWLRHSTQGELDWHDAKNIAQSKIMYTLPTPEYKSMLKGT